MSQAEQSSQLVQKLKEELKRCQNQCQQVYSFVEELSTNLEVCHQLMQNLEDEIKSKSQTLANVEHEFEEFRRRIKTQENQNLQYKTALQRCLSSNTKPEAYLEARRLLDAEPDAPVNPPKRISKAEKKSTEDSTKSFSSIKLPQFAPLKPR